MTKPIWMKLNRSWITWLAATNTICRFELQLLYFPSITDRL
jgi:hypothetical protein